MEQSVSAVAMTRVTFQNSQKLVLNQIYFAYEFGDISFSLSNNYADLKKILQIQFFKKLKKYDFSWVKELDLQNFFNLRIHYVKKSFNTKEMGLPNSFLK